ncbi:kinase domain-containing protein [Favolaschia claudopus]|uniref:Kinase domain-containing protein n=1 Tax=Favolaschia claudopus TaxID=2862362 RepID=A0AAW0B017_9AGAR
MRFLERNPEADRAKIVYDVVLGMQYLHARSVVHGSLKPANILIAGNGNACVSDYGMIEAQTSGSHGHRYFSPEAWKGTVSRSSDVFAWAMSALEIFTSKAPWGILSEKQIFRLVVRQDSRPDRPDEDFGLTDHIWGLMEECWHRQSRLRPTFDILVHTFQTREGDVQIGSRAAQSSLPRAPVVASPQPHGPGDSLASLASYRAYRSRQTFSMISGPPDYEVASIDSQPDSAPPALSHFTPLSKPSRSIDLTSRPEHSLEPREGSSSEGRSVPQRPHYHVRNGIDTSRPSSPDGSSEDKALSLQFNNSISLQASEASNTSWNSRGRLGPSPSIRSSSGAPRSGFRAAATRPKNIGTIGEEDPSYIVPATARPFSPPATPQAYPHWRHPEPANSWHTSSTSTLPMAEYGSRPGPSTPANVYAESIRSHSTGTGPNPNLLAGALLTEVKDGRKREVIDGYLYRIQQLCLKSHKDIQKFVTAGIITTLISLLNIRAVDGVGIETVLLTLGILAHDPIPANTIYRTGTSATLIEIVDSAQSDDIAALAVWCLARICRTVEVSNDLLKLNICRLLITKGLERGPRTSRISAWCFGCLCRSDGIAESMANMGLVTALCEHLWRCAESINAVPEDHSATLYAVARLARSIKISKALSQGGCVERLAHFLLTAEDPRVLQWSARAIGCLMRPNSSDMAKILLDAGVARGLARLPSMLSTEEVEPLGSFAFAIQRFSCAEWGGGTRKALVDAGVVDSLLAALRTAADEPYPQVHIELAYAIALLSDVGGASIRKEIVNAGGINILKQIAAAARPDVAKACNLAATSINGNVWSRNAASAKAAMAHEWTGGCPDYLPECPVLLYSDNDTP